MDKENTVLDNLYALRAGLSVISQEYDKAQAIEDDCDGELAEHAESFSGSLICYDLNRNEYDNTDYFYELEKLQKRYGYEKDFKADDSQYTDLPWSRRQEIVANLYNENRNKGKKAYNRWLADNECDSYFNRLLKAAQRENDLALSGDIGGFNYKKESKREKILSIVFFAITAGIMVILSAMFAGACGKWNEGIADVLTLVFVGIFPLLLFLILGIVYVCKSKQDLARYKRKLNEVNEQVTAARWLLDNLPQAKDTARGILKQKDAKISPIKESCNEFYMALKKQFSSLLDERDWKNLDLVIYELETGRADNVKEALQLVDRELQTERIQQTIVQATEQICYEIRRGFAELKSTIIACSRVLSAQLSEISSKLSHMSGQLSELCDGVNMSNALQAKANVSSVQLLSEVHAIRYYR